MPGTIAVQLPQSQVKCVYGIQYGYKGFYAHDWRHLDLGVVRDIHKTGGTILGTSRGGFDLDRFVYL